METLRVQGTGGVFLQGGWIRKQKKSLLSLGTVTTPLVYKHMSTVDGRKLWHEASLVLCLQSLRMGSDLL